MLCVSSTPLLVHDNAPAHEALVAKTSLRVYGFEELSHSPYSTYLALCNFYLFLNLKGHLCVKHFEDDNELKTVTEEWLYEQDIKKSHQHLTSCSL